ncbi:LytTR family DNA-binding domain-containing protein [Lewinella sp. W8]|uniref:LytR/AlgR family response regulator transcription factor n=1 Tax=Lewinella sp. W8 TaxID=2528208 RepID=UPI001067AFAC|nr:response regulator transcription factor [Lewinella sp. W8]MTB52573.1 response regulator [Lewinella sp. W8]
MEPIRTLIVDDEPLARTGMSDYLNRLDYLTEVGQARDGLEALNLLQSKTVELMLLDVQMPGLSGVELLRGLRKPPLVIFTTAHPSFAVEGFELEAVDYLLKPIPFTRFLRAAQRAVDRLRPTESTIPTTPEMPAPALRRNPPVIEDADELRGNRNHRQNERTPAANGGPADIFIREEGRVERVMVQDILFAESMQNYCKIHTAVRTYLPLLPLKDLEAALPTTKFFRIHRSYLVRLGAVTALEGNQVRIGEALLPVSRAQRSELERALVGDRLL